MAHRKKSKRILGICLIAFVIIIGALLGVLYSMRDTTKPSDKTIDDTAPVHSISNAQIHRFADQGTIDKYLGEIKNSRAIKQEYVHGVPSVSWDRQDVIAIEYSMHVGRSFQQIQVETINGRPTIVITTQEPGRGCMTIQVNEVNVFFVSVAKGNVNYPVALRVLPNDTSCELKK